MEEIMTWDKYINRLDAWMASKNAQVIPHPLFERIYALENDPGIKYGGALSFIRYTGEIASTAQYTSLIKESLNAFEELVRQVRNETRRNLLGGVYLIFFLFITDHASPDAARSDPGMPFIQTRPFKVNAILELSSAQTHCRYALFAENLKPLFLPPLLYGRDEPLLDDTIGKIRANAFPFSRLLRKLSRKEKNELLFLRQVCNFGYVYETGRKKLENFLEFHYLSELLINEIVVSAIEPNYFGDFKDQVSTWITREASKEKYIGNLRSLCALRTAQGDFSAAAFCPKCHAIVSPVLYNDPRSNEPLYGIAQKIKGEAQYRLTCANDPQNHSLDPASILYGMPEEKAELISGLQICYERKIRP